MSGEPVAVSADFEVPSRSRALSKGRELLEQHFHLICQRLDRLSRLSGLPPQEAEDLRSWALLKLVENDYRILASWEGRSSFPTFLAVVLVNLTRDYRTHLWGKWRPSSAARQHGPEAMLLERLWVRDNLPLEEAINTMQTVHGVSLSRAELERMAASPPQRMERRRVSEEELLLFPVDGRVDSRIEEGELSHIEGQVRELLAPLLQSLPDPDRLLLKLHYWEGLSIAAISHLLDRPQRELYVARDKCLKKLLRSLEGAGLRAAQVRRLLGYSHLALAPDDV
jgi:RNA polymerase sigma factor (sigma-70 family)